MSQNQRKQPRKSTNVTTRISYLSSRTEKVENTLGETIDLSRGGVQLKLPRLSEIEEIRELMMNLPGQDEPIKTNAELRWTSEQNGSGFAGIRFTSLSTSQQKQIEGYLGYEESYEILDKATLLRFQEMKAHMKQMLDLSDSNMELMNKVSPLDVYYCSEIFEIDTNELAELIAEHLEVEYISSLKPQQVKLDRLPAPFCKNYNTVSIKREEEDRKLVISNPFNHLFYSSFYDYHGDLYQSFAVTQPSSIHDALEKKIEEEKSIPHYSPSTIGPFVLNVGFILESDAIPFSHYNESKEFYDLEEKAEENQPETVDHVLKHLLATMLEENKNKTYLNHEEDQLKIRTDPEEEPEAQLKLPDYLARALFVRIKILSGLDLTDQWQTLEGKFKIKYFDYKYTVRSTVQPGLAHGKNSLKISKN